MVCPADALTSCLEEFSLETRSDLLQIAGVDADAQRRTGVETLQLAGTPVRRFTNEFWTAGQRGGHSLHEISYRACFKAELPRFFIERLTRPGDLVYDPFMGRGTTLLEAALLGRRVAGNDVNPLSRMLLAPRLEVPELDEIARQLEEILLPEREGEAPAEPQSAVGVRSCSGSPELSGRIAARREPRPPKAERGRSVGVHANDEDIDLSMFYSAGTLRRILRLRNYLRQRRTAGAEDAADRWIRMAATNRLTGHSPGFFSVYTLPPNQAVSPRAQLKINSRRGQTPPERDVAALILKKSRSLQKDLTAEQRRRLRAVAAQGRFFEQDARRRSPLADESVALVVTSPPFLNTVQYAADNWLRCWFNGLDAQRVGRSITVTGSLAEWTRAMTETLAELHRVLKPGGWIAFEVGEVRRGALLLDEVIAPAGVSAGLRCRGIMINRQIFTKTANCWGVANNRKGTNTNRIVLFQKDS